ncbi:MAG TPA: response regulator [Usitatibacter sp.]|nr:response regulator [Usitatibacter sp.]
MDKRILIVEDDEKSRRLLRDVLGYHGFCVEEACTGEEALGSAATRLPDAVLLDIQLPGLNGFEVLRRLRAIDGARFPVLAVTASVMDHDRKRILEAGFDAYVAKPVNIRELLHALKGFLEPLAP